MAQNLWYVKLVIALTRADRNGKPCKLLYFYWIQLRASGHTGIRDAERQSPIGQKILSVWGSLALGVLISSRPTLHSLVYEKPKKVVNRDKDRNKAQNEAFGILGVLQDVFEHLQVQFFGCGVKRKALGRRD